jgi:TP901 family phage tail tape measure protein
MAFNDTPIAGGDVVFKANTGQFKGDMVEIQAVYGRTVGAMSDEALKLAVAQDKLNRSLLQMGPESAAAGRATLSYRAQVDSLAKSELAAAAASKRAAEQRLAAYAGAAKNVGSTLTRFVTAPTALLTAAAVKMGVDFQQQMLLIQTQAGASASEVHKLSGEVLQLAKVTPQGPEQLAQGLYHLESLGLRGAIAMHTLRTAALAAGMGIADLESTATALGAVVVTGIKGAQNYDHAMGLLVGTVGAGNVRMEDLAASIGNVAPAGAAAGVSLTEIGAAIATMTDRGFTAATATTRLRMALALIQSPSDKAKKSLADMGVDADKLGAMLREPNGLLKVLETLHDAIDKVGKARGNRDLLAGFGGGRSGLGIQTLVQSLDSTVSSYKQKLTQVDEQSKRFAANQQAYLHSEAYELHHDLATMESDLTSAGGKLAPVLVDVVGVVTALVDGVGHLPEPFKIAAGVIVGLLAVGGPVLLAIAGVIRAVQTIGNAFTRSGVQAGESIAFTDEQLATLRANLALTEEQVAALGTSEGTAGAGGLLGGRLGGLGGRLGTAGGFAIGGLVAGSIAGSVIPGEAGRATSRALEFAGVGAAIGELTPLGPAGAAAGAGIGALAGAASALIHEGPSFSQQLAAMGHSVNAFGTLAAKARDDVTALHSQIANDRVARDQAEQALKQAEAEEQATRGTKAHAAAVDRLNAAQYNLQVSTQKLRSDQQQLNQAESTRTSLLAKDSKATQDFTGELAQLAREVQTSTPEMQRLYSVNQGLTSAIGSGTAKLQIYVDRMQKLADSMQATNPRMARVIHNLVQIAEDMKRIPNAKTIRITVDETIRGTFSGVRVGPGGDIFPTGSRTAVHGKQGSGSGTKPTTHHRSPRFTTNIPIDLQIKEQEAQNANNTALELKYLQEQKAFLERELQLAKTKKQRLAALQAIGAVDSQISSLEQQEAAKRKKRTDTTASNYQKHVDSEERRLKLNVARAKLAETNAGENKKALERALVAERRALNDEIDFYRKEAHDQQLAAKERQKHAADEIAAEKARAEVNQKLKKAKADAAKQEKTAAQQAEAQFLSQVRDVFLQYAGNVFQPPAPQPPVVVNQSFPATPTDQHRQARYARTAMQAAFAS